jgi:hypothetical protein
MLGMAVEDVVEPLEEVAHLAAEEAAQRAQQRADHRGQQRGHHADEDRDLGALDGLGQHVAAQAVAAERQRLAFGGLGGLVLARAFGPLGVARRQRVDVATGRRSGPGVSMAPWPAAPRAGPMSVGGALGTATSSCQPGHQAQAAAHDQQHEGQHHHQRHHAHAVGLEAAPGGVPDAFGSLRSASGSRGSGVRAPAR